MSIGKMTVEEVETASRNLKIFDALAIVGMLAGLGFWIAMDVTSEKWGVAYSPERMMMLCAYSLLATMPLWLWSTYRYMSNQKWLAEDIGVPYEPGKKYPVWTTKRIVAIALGIALFGISGVVPATTFDLPQFVATFLTVLYGPIEGGIGVGLGFLLIRGPLFSGILNPFQLIAYCFGDGMIYFVAGQFYREYIHYKPLSWRLTIGLATYVLCVNFFHAGFYIPGLFWGVAGDYIRFGPRAVSLARRVWRMAYWIPVAWFPNIVGAYLVATALQKYKV